MNPKTQRNIQLGMGKFLLFSAAKCNTKDGTAVRNVTPEVNASVDMNASVCGCECECVQYSDPAIARHYRQPLLTVKPRMTN